MTAITASRPPRPEPDRDPEPRSRRRLSRSQIAARGAVMIAVAAILLMWVYAFLLADDRPAAAVDDTAWTKRAEHICQVRDDLLDQNATDAARVSDGTPQAIGAAVRRATDVIEDSLAEVLAVRPTSAGDVRLVDEWETLYRIYLHDRRDAETRLLAGEAVELNESLIDGSPVSLTIGDFSKHNRMPSCAVPVGR